MGNRTVYHFLRTAIFMSAVFVFHFASAQITSETSPEKIFSKVNPIVVRVEIRDSKKVIAHASGIALRNQEYIVINAHILQGARTVAITRANETVTFTGITGIDSVRDVVILKSEDNTFPFLPIGKTDSLEAGDKIFVIGSPDGKENTITEGVITELDAADNHKKQIKISAEVTTGTTGGAVVNEKGELLGMAKLVMQGTRSIGYLVPIDEIMLIEIRDYINQNESGALNYYFKGNSAQRADNMDLAIAYYRKAIQLIPDYLAAYQQLGNALSNTNDFNGAIACYEKVIQLDSTYTGAYNNLAIVYSNRNDYEKALGYYQKAIAIKPDESLYYNNLADAYMNLNKYDDAIKNLEKAIAIDTKQWLAYLTLAELHLKRAEYKDAIQILEKALAQEKKLPYLEDFHYYLGVANYKLGDYEKANNYFSTSLDINPKLSEAFYFRGLSYSRQAKNPQAKENFKKAYELNPELKALKKKDDVILLK